MSRADDSYIVELLRLEEVLRAYLHRFAPRPSDLEDLLQETYTRLLAVAADDRTAIKSVQAFALASARNVAVDWTRRRRTVPFDFVADLDALPIADGEGLEGIVNAHQELTQLAQAVAS